MKKRGKVVRDTSVGTGLLMAGGKQYPFELEGMWQSETAPRVNMVVDVEIDDEGNVDTVTFVPETQLAREQAEVAMHAARDKGLTLGKEAVARFGAATLGAMIALVLGWFVLSTVNVQISGSYSEGLTLWKILGVLNSPAEFMRAVRSGNGGAGVYGFLACVALAGPLLPFFIKDRRATLGGLLPLAFMIFVGYQIYAGLISSLQQMNDFANILGGAEAARYARQIAAEVTKEALRAFSLGLGAYLAFAASVFFAGRSVIKYFASRA